MKEVYGITHTLSQKRQRRIKPAKDKNGLLLTNEKKKQIERWEEYYKIFNSPIGIEESNVG